MTLTRKFILRQLLSIAGILLLGTGAIWGFFDVKSQVGQALDGHDQTQALQAVLLQTLRARASLGTSEAARTRVGLDIRESIESLQNLITQQGPGPNHVCTISSKDQLRRAKQVVGRLKQANGLIQAGGPPDLAATGSALDAAATDLSSLFKTHTESIHDQTAMAGQTSRIALSTTSGCVAIVLAVCSTISALQYRGMLLPILLLHAKLRKRTASGAVVPLEEKGDREFSEVAHEFNRMNAEIVGFQNGMEQMVVAKSKELVRSERLASVGFLAAGVAHEINNPLNIISGFAELCAKRLAKAGADDASVQETLQALQVIRDEAFRCKEITGRLLSLARGGTNSREVLSLKQVARDVALMTRGLKDHRNRKIVLRFNESDPLQIRANPTEMKQVLLNLTVNALEAVSSGVGEVRIEGRRLGQWIELCVSDNGRGMGPESIKHVFEPFFTEKRGCAEPGTGLGLTVTHAIVESHGGRIRAESDGPGRGARFIIQFPAHGESLAN